MRAYSGWLAAVLVGAMVATPDGQQGQGANIGSNDATAVLRSGPLSRMPGEPVQVLSAMPDRFPRELLPEGAAFAAAATSPSLTIVVMSLLSYANGSTSTSINGASKSSGGSTSTARGLDLPSTARAAVRRPRCARAGEFARVWVETRPSGARFLRVGLGPEPRRSCAPMGMRVFSDVALPMLELPPSVQAKGSGSSGGVDETQAAVAARDGAVSGIARGELHRADEGGGLATRERHLSETASW